MTTLPSLDQQEEREFLGHVDADDVTQTAAIGRDITPADGNDDAPIPAIGGYLGRCLLQVLIAAGRNSAVYLGKLWDLHLPVAVKVVVPRRAEDRPVLMAHLRSEFIALSRLTHSNVPRLWDYREELDHPHLATEYVESLTLEQLRRKHGGRIPLKMVIRIALRALEGLAAAWRIGFVHRDVKPNNLLYTPGGEVKVIDWGLSTMVGAGLPCTPSADTVRFVGTPAYLPPEMARPGKPFDHRTDVYALGASLYHAVTGRLPFDYRRPTQMILAHLTEVPVPPFDYVQEPGMLRMTDVIMRMMAKNPSDRFEKPDELHDELTRTLSDATAGNSRYIALR